MQSGGESQGSAHLLCEGSTCARVIQLYHLKSVYYNTVIVLGWVVATFFLTPSVRGQLMRYLGARFPAWHESQNHFKNGTKNFLLFGCLRTPWCWLENCTNCTHLHLFCGRSHSFSHSLGLGQWATLLTAARVVLWGVDILISATSKSIRFGCF